MSTIMDFTASDKKIWLSSPTTHEEERRYVKEAFDTNWISTVGENLDRFEQEVCDYVGCRAAVALSSGTAAIHLALKLAGVQEQDIVLCQDMTFAATVNPVIYEKGIPVFIDSEEDTWNMDPEALKIALDKYSGRVKAVIVVHLYGTPARMNEIVSLCREYQVALIEDAAESLSATYDGKQTGTLGDYGIFSFNGNKIITTSGGGMLLSDDREAVKKARFWSAQSRDAAPWYQHSSLGYNYRMSNVLAGIGRGQLLHLEEHKRRKQEIYERYREAFVQHCLPVQMNPYLENSDPNFWLSCITLDAEIMKKGSVTPEKLRTALEARQAESRPIWKPMHMQPYYAGRDYITADGRSVDEDIFARGLCLPSDIKMTEEEQNKIIAIICDCFET